MSRKIIVTLSIIIAIFAFALWVLIPLDSTRLDRTGMRLGLDLVGGVHLVYNADFPDDATDEEKKQDINRALDTIQRRINTLGVVEPIIQQQENQRLVIQLPGFTDIEAAKAMVEKTGFLEFRQVELTDMGEPVYLSNYLAEDVVSFINGRETGSRIFVTPPDLTISDETHSEQAPFIILNHDAAGNLVFTNAEGNTFSQAEVQAKLDKFLKGYPGSANMPSWIPARGEGGKQITGAYLAEAQAEAQQGAASTDFVIAITWDDEGADMFDYLAARLFTAGEQGSLPNLLGIFLDQTLISSPRISQANYDGTGQIQGSFTYESVQHLATLLQSGSLPMPLEKPPLYEEKVSATLGADFIETSVLACIIGVILVMLFMIAYYRLPGLLASLSLMFYGAVVLTIFKLMPVTLTLAGIGGFVLSIGMAVDANVLIFERMREELRTGRTVGAAIEAGFNRAWTAIRDSNITTFIVCAILYWLGSNIVASGPVMGFAVTLFIGVAVSMFTAIIVTRTLLRVTLHTSLGHKQSLYITDTGKK
jgi:protein-export membrane protein SecD